MLVIGIVGLTLMTGITVAGQDPLVDTAMDTAFHGKLHHTLMWNKYKYPETK